ncbi:cupin domain-containing protein [Halomicrobium urmianum]|uniref:cupin domain-containing protein n=1 Tax=Halomicrobium urmianum TaxID=1586233 RepID=UPI001CD93B54|nr:cupin domain-containing protein [Halomicrobium urmianum]
MGYRIVPVDEIDPTPDRPSVQRAISDVAGLDNVAVNLYEPEPGEPIPLAYHYHDEQEELFYVLAGRLVVETPEGDLEATRGEVIVVEPENPQYARNPEDASETAKVLAIGAPSVDDVHAYEE